MSANSRKIRINWKVIDNCKIREKETGGRGQTKRPTDWNLE